MERAILDVIEVAAASGEQAAVATVIRTIHSAPRQPGAKLAVTESGRLVGSVSGGCVEADVAERARAVFAGEPPALVHYGVSDSDAFAVGLPCGGEIDVWLELADVELWRQVRMLVDDGGVGTLYTNTATGEKSLVRDVLEPTELREDGVFAEAIEGPLRLIVVGAVDTAQHLCAYGRELGWFSTVVDPRAALATRERLPSADEIVCGWPEEIVERIDERTAVVTLSHDERLDLPVVAAALRRGARYVGALGSKRTAERRRAGLRELGLADADIERVHGPVGLDLGGRAPAEIALSIAAQIVAESPGRSAPRTGPGLRHVSEKKVP